MWGIKDEWVCLLEVRQEKVNKSFRAATVWRASYDFIQLHLKAFIFSYVSVYTSGYPMRILCCLVNS